MEINFRTFAFIVKTELHFGVVEGYNDGSTRIFRITLLDDEFDMRLSRAGKF